MASKYVIVNHEWEATDEGEISINVGDIIRVTYEDESGWWTGVIEETGLEGVFPSNFSDPYTPPPPKQQPAPIVTQPPKQEPSKEDLNNFLYKVKAISEYEGNPEDDELSFSEGDVIRVYATDESGWWQGRIEGKMDVLSWFPSNFVEELPDKPEIPEKPKKPEKPPKPQIQPTVEEEEDDYLQKLDSLTTDSEKLVGHKKARRKTQAPSNPRGFTIGNTVEVVERVEVVEAPSEEETQQPKKLPMGLPMGMNLAFNLSELKGKITTGLKKTTKDVPSKSAPPPNKDDNPLPFKSILKSSGTNPTLNKDNNNNNNSNNNNPPVNPFPLKSALKTTPLKNPGGGPPHVSPPHPTNPPSSSHPLPNSKAVKGGGGGAKKLEKTEKFMSVQLPNSNFLQQQQQQQDQQQQQQQAPPQKAPPQPSPNLNVNLPPPISSNPNTTTSNNNNTTTNTSQPLQPFKLPTKQAPPLKSHSPTVSLPSKPKMPPPKPLDPPTSSTTGEGEEVPFSTGFSDTPLRGSGETNHTNHQPSVSTPTTTTTTTTSGGNPVGWPTETLGSFTHFSEELSTIFNKHKQNTNGKNVSSKNAYCICIKTKDGTTKKFGDENVHFPLKEASTPLLYSLLSSSKVDLSSHSLNQPSLSNFQLDSDKPSNLFTSKGLCTLSSLAFDHFGKTKWEKIGNVLEKLNHLTKGRVACSMSSYMEMREKDDLFSALFHLLSFSQNLPSTSNTNDLLDFCRQVASLEVDCETLCDLSFSLSQDCTNSMKESSGFNVPLVSSSSGVTLLVHKNAFSITIYSPIIDKNGNSTRGLAIAKEIIQKLF